MIAWFFVLLVASLAFAVVLAAKRPANPLAGPSYFDRHPTIVLTILAALAAIVVFPVFVISLPFRAFKRRSHRLAPHSR